MAKDKMLVPDEWTRKQMQQAIDDILATGVFQGARVEARVAWVLKESVLVGQIREVIDQSRFRWIVAGNNVPTDHVDGAVAATPREALRHFCLKWQLGADRVTQASENDPETGDLYRQRAATLVKQAEDLYEIVEADQFWS